MEAEVLRYTSLTSTRAAFVKRLSKNETSSFDQLHFSLLQRAPSGFGVDPLLPTIHAADWDELETFLRLNLTQNGTGSKASNELASWTRRRVIKASSDLSKKLRRLGTKVSKRGKLLAQEQVHDESSRSESLVSLTHSSDRRRVEIEYPGLEIALHIHSGHFEKLRGLYDAAPEASEIHKRKRPHQCTEGEFDMAVAQLLLRYRALSGGGFQCSLTAPVFQCMRDQFGVAFEGFASPLNCHFGAGNYFSAFPDTDRAFGSLGSFFDSTPIRGSFELNPPFSADLYSKIVLHCEGLLLQADRESSPLSFILVIGATPAALALPVVKSLVRSTFYRGSLIVPVESHVYVSGQQHLRGSTETFRACDTGVYFFQSEAANLQWPVTPEKIDALRRAFTEEERAP